MGSVRRMSGTEFTPARFDVIHTAPAWMTPSELTFLYGLVGGLAPKRVLEIGTFKGGSTVVICAALDDHRDGQILCVDPDPRLAPETLAKVEHRATIVAEPSPEAVSRAREIAGGPFDFALVDGDHSFDGVVRDIDATLPTLADEAHLLFHDAHFHQVREAIDQILGRDERLADAGLVSRQVTVDEDGNSWGGLRLLHFSQPVT